MLPILIITLIIYLGMIFCTKRRIAITLVGAGLLFIFGVFSNSFDPLEAFSAFPGEIVVLIIVLTLFTSTFERLGFINYIGYHFLRLTKENKTRIVIFLPLLVYFVSLFMNNLTVVLFFTAISLFMIIEYDLPAVPVLVSIIIGSNIGGAPLPWADTPAVVLTLYTNFNLLDFLNKMFTPCLIYAIGLAVYTYIWYKHFPMKREIPFKKLPPVNWKALHVPLILFVLYIISASVGPFFNVSLAYVSLFFGGLLLFATRKDEMIILNHLPILDSLVFLITLFLIGGVLQHAGLLTLASEYIIGLTNNNIYLITFAILLIAFATSTLLSAGPAAATLLPICKMLEPLIPFKLIYAALALGILAGSSMLPWSATGGPILLSQTRSFIDHHFNGPKPNPDFGHSPKRFEIETVFHLKTYLAFSVPFALAMLIISGIYLATYIFILQ